MSLKHQAIAVNCFCFISFRSVVFWHEHKIFNRSQQLIVICLLAQRVRDVNEWKPIFIYALLASMCCRRVYMCGDKLNI